MFKPQKGEDIENCTEPLTFPKLVSTKLDGIRAVTLGGKALTYSLKPVPNNHIRTMLSLWPNLDGEIIYGEANADDVCRKTNSAVRRIHGEPEFKFYVFDDLSDFSLTFEQRLDKLNNRTLPPYIHVLQQFEVHSQEVLDSTYKAVLDQGFEGLMARNPKSMYKFGRCTAKSQDSLKIKPFRDDNAQVLSVYEAQYNGNEATIDELGRTHRSSHAANKTGNGMAGGFWVTADGEVFKVSAGKMSHPEREAVLRNREKYPGRWLKYRHMPSGVLNAPRFGRWIAWREVFDM